MVRSLELAGPPVARLAQECELPPADDASPAPQTPALDRAHRVLLETARQLGGSLDPHAIFARLLDSVRGSMRCDGLVVSSFDAAEGLIRCVYCWTGGRELDPATLPPIPWRSDSPGMQSQVIRTGRPMMFADVAQRVRDPKATYYEVESSGKVRDLGASEAPPAVQSALMVPLLLEGRVTGVVQVMADASAAHDPADLEMLEAISLLLAVALENARLYRRSHEEQRTLREAEDRYRAFVANSTEGIYRIEFEPPIDVALPVDEQVRLAYANGRLAECNDAFARMYGYERGSELTGIGVGVLLPEADAAAVAHVRRVIESGYRVVDAESEERARDGSTVWISNNIEGVPERGLLHRIWGTQRDITDRRRTEKALLEADRRKDEFLATLAHELRNPLNPLRSAVEVLRRVAGNDPQLRWSQSVIQRQVAHLGRLVDDLLDVGRITGGKFELRRAPVALDDVLATAVESVHATVEEHRQLLEIRRGDGPVTVDADAVRLAQVFGNLLDNASKYSSPGGRIEVRVTRADGDVVVEVRDEGIGIGADQLPRVFDWFYQGDRPVDRAPGGLGVGLALVKRLVEMHGGAITARSDGAGRGCAFAVRLPAIEAPAQAAGLAPRADVAAPVIEPRVRRVLVADDNRDSADAMAVLLRLDGHEVETAYDGHEAVRTADAFQPDVLVLDLGLPGIDGCEVARRVRERPWGKEALLVAATGWGQPEDRRRTEDTGFHAHLVKPVDPDVLLGLLRHPASG